MRNYVTIGQAAEICSVDRSTMNRWTNAGKIKAYRTAGGHKRILKTDLEAFLKDNDIPIQNIKNQNQYKILIVDDDDSVKRYLKKVLDNPFFKLDFASDGFEAGRQLSDFQPDLIILDLFMPNMDGFQVCEHIKQDPKRSHTKILILTGQGTEENKKRALLSGADMVLDKPSAKKEILDTVYNLLV